MILNGVINCGLKHGVGSGTERGLDSVKVSFESSILVVIVLLPVIRPHPILTLCQGAIAKHTRYIAPLNN